MNIFEYQWVGGIYDWHLSRISIHFRAQFYADSLRKIFAYEKGIMLIKTHLSSSTYKNEKEVINTEKHLWKKTSCIYAFNCIFPMDVDFNTNMLLPQHGRAQKLSRINSNKRNNSYIGIVSHNYNFLHNIHRDSSIGKTITLGILSWIISMNAPCYL